MPKVRLIERRMSAEKPVPTLGVGASCSRMTRLGRKGSLPVPKLCIKERPTKSPTIEIFAFVKI